jgi:hypothetical protein
MVKKIPKQKDKKHGWTIDYNTLFHISETNIDDIIMHMEDVEAVIIALSKLGYVELEGE